MKKIFYSAMALTLGFVLSSTTCQGPDPTPDPNFSITSPHSFIKVDFLSCKAQGNDVVLEFTLTNNGSTNLSYFRIWGSGTYGSIHGQGEAFDTNGKAYGFSIAFGGGTLGYIQGFDDSPLSIGVPVKAVVTIYNVGVDVGKFSIVKLETRYGSIPYTTSAITFRNMNIAR